MQAVVDGKGLFWDLCVGYPGSTHDARVLRQSYLWKMLNDGHPLNQSKVHISGCDVGYYLIGDSGLSLAELADEAIPRHEQSNPTAAEVQSQGDLVQGQLWTWVLEG